MNADEQVCLRCIGDDELRRQLRTEATRGKCGVCGKRRQSVPLHRIAEQVDPVYREYYRPGGDEAHFDPASDNPRYEQAGEEPQYIIQEITGVEPEVADAIVDYLSDGEAHNVHDGAEPQYDNTSRYVVRDFHATELHIAWEEFCQRVKHQRRFFDEEGRSMLSTILGDGESIENQDNPLSACVVTLKKGHRCFRGRRAENDEAAGLILHDPRRLLGPPPPHLTPPGRMNPAGISVFYGGFSEDVCIAEVRPHVGGLVVVGEFRTGRSLRLLDLTMLDNHGFPGSMFGSDFYERVAKRQFLRSFHNLISRPVQPHEEILEYLPTQAVAEYISNVLGLDGIIYESAQTGGSGDEDEDRLTDPLKQNVALFSRAALVEGTRNRRKRPGPLLTEWNEANIDTRDQRRPSLRFVKNSAHPVRVTAIKVSHQREYLRTPLSGNRRFLV
jgi:hypothetical protein